MISTLKNIIKPKRKLELEQPMEPEQPNQDLYEYDVRVDLLFWGNCKHEELVTIQGYDEEQCRLDAYYRVLDRFSQAIYGQATVITSKRIDINNQKQGALHGN